MPDETYRLEIQDNLQDVTQRATNAKRAVDDLSASLDKAGSSGHTFPKPGEYISTNELKENMEKISAAQDRWALSTMNHAERIEYLNTKVNQQVEGTDAWYNAQAQLNAEMKKGDDSLTQIARNFTPMIGAGRALSELGRSAGIFGRLIGDDDLSRVSQMTVALGELVMVGGRLPQVAAAMGVSMAGLGAAGAGIAAIAAISSVTNRSPARTVAGAWNPFVESGQQAGAETRQWLQSIGVQLPNFGEALDKATNGTDKFADAAQRAAALVDFNNKVYDEKRNLDKMDEGQLKVASQLFSLMGGATSPLGLVGIRTPYNELSAYAQSQTGVARDRATPAGQLRQAISEGNVSTVDRMFPTNAMDLTKYSQQEITQAKLMSVAATQSELQALRQQAQALGLNKDEVDKVVKLRQDEIDSMRILVTLQGQSSYLTGSEANHLQEMLSEIKTSQKQEKDSFNFQRLSNVSSAQFPQLAGLAAMYNQMLTKLGSPEKSETQNLLLSDGTFKTMNVRLTALQLALEDLTKVEKAQLSGTWNLPAGATALVPISSLDIQRWNKSEGGMPDLSALLGATNRSGDMVANSQQVAATRIVAALHEVFSKVGIPTGATDRAKTVTEAIAMAREQLKTQSPETVGKFYDEWAKAGQPMVYRFTEAVRPMMDYFNYQQRDYVHTRNQQNPIMSQYLKGVGSTQNVTVTPMPLKATFNANLLVTLNGAVVARALMPVLFDQLVRLTQSAGYRQVGAQR